MNRISPAARAERVNAPQVRPSRQQRIRVFLVDDYPVVREGFARAIERSVDLVVVGQAGTAKEALNEIVLAAPDVVLVDLGLPDLDGIELLPALLGLLPAVRLIVLSGCEDDFRAAAALRAGAHGYLVKSDRTDEIVAGIRSCCAGGAPLSAAIAPGVLRAAIKRPSEDPSVIGSLTPRERQVLGMLVAGAATREVAVELAISPKTVETHRIRIFAKLNCRNLMDLTRFALRTGLIDP